jgi:ubiquinone/menaquinone biosynthesis C-methylase UbiE
VNLIQDFKYLDVLAKFGVGGAHPGGLNLTKEIMGIENINSTSQILDVGCGTGQTAAYLASTYGANVTGIDIDPIMVTKAKQRIKNNRLPVKIMQGSIENIPLPDQLFDFILSESVLSFVNQPKALNEISRLLKSDGRFIAIEHTVIKQLTEKDENEIKQFYGFHSLNTQEDWVASLNQAGFEQILIQKSTIIESEPDYHFSEEIEPELYEIMAKHIELTSKHLGDLDYRIYLCTK